MTELPPLPPEVATRPAYFRAWFQNRALLMLASRSLAASWARYEAANLAVWKRLQAPDVRKLLRERDESRDALRGAMRAFARLAKRDSVLGRIRRNVARAIAAWEEECAVRRGRGWPAAPFPAEVLRAEEDAAQVCGGVNAWEGW